MTSVEKCRSSRRSGGHRKHSDGGFSDTSSGGSYLDENDREVRSLTDRAFRSLCIGDEAVYNDSDLGLSSPSTQRDRQLAFSHSCQDRDIEDREREGLKQAAHENFSLRVQQYGQDWIHGGIYGAEIHGNPQWEVFGGRTQGRVSATFQHSFVETSQQEKCLKEEDLSFFSNGGTELSSQQHRSRSRVSSLIRAFNSEGQRDDAGIDDKLRDWNDETSWDKSALMSIQKELSEFSTSYQQYNTSNFPSVGPFLSRDANYYSSEGAAMTHRAHNAASYMRSSHSQHSMSQGNCSSNFFIHSEFSPFKVWREHNRFPYQQGEVSGFMHCSEFPKWYETPIYKELSIDNQPQSNFRGFRHPKNNLAPVATQTSSRSTSTSSVLQKAPAVEKRCESELAGHFPHRKRTQSLGNHKLPSQRPSTASPTIEMSRRVRDTISTVKALQQKIKMMTEQNNKAGVITNQQGALYRDDHLIHSGNNALTVEPNVVSSNTSTTPFNISQLLTPLVHAHQETETSAFQQYEVSPQPVEHAPVRAESRGATPDVRMSSYKSRATGLLFNLKDNRKRVKSIYSPTKFKGLDTVDKNKQSSVQEPKETVKDIPKFPDPDVQFLQLEESKRTNAAVNQYYSPRQSITTHNCQPARLNTGQYPENTANDYQAVQMQGQTVHHSGFSGFMPENYTRNQLANGQNPHEYLASFTPYNQGVIENVGTLGGPKQPYVTMNTAKQNADNNQSREYLISSTNTEQAFNETVGSVFTKVDTYEQLSVNKQDYNLSSQDTWKQAMSQDTEKLSMKKVISPSEQGTAPSMEGLRKENLPSQNKELEKLQLRESFSFEASSHNMAGLIKTNISNHLQGQQGQKKNGLKDVNLPYIDNEYRSKHEVYSTTNITQKTGQINQHTTVLKACEMQSLQQIETKPQIENYIQKNSLCNPDNVLVPTMTNQFKERQLSDVKGELMAAQRKAQHTELTKAQQRAQVEQPTAESAGLMLAAQVGSVEIKTDDSKSELSKLESKRQAKEEHIKDEKKKREQTEKSREKQPEQAREEQTKVEAIRAQKLIDKTTNIKEKEKEKKSHVLDRTDEQSKQVKAEQADTEKLMEEHIKTNLEKSDLAGPEMLKQHKNEQATNKRITKEQVDEEQLRAEQVEGEQMQPEQIRTEKVNVEQAGTESGKAEQREEIRQTQSKAKHVKTKEVEVGDVKTANIKTEDARQAKAEKDSIHMALVNADKSATEISTARDTKLEERNAQEADKKLEKTKSKVELSKTENLLERSAKLTAKLAATQQVRSEPDKVEQVKTELAKAKAELAKIKDKMRGEQKEKVKTNLVLKENDSSKDSVPVKMHLDENKTQELAVQIQTYRGVDEYAKLREKYGFTSSASLSNKVSTTESGPLNDASKTKVLPTEEVEKENNKLKDGHSPTSTSMIANKDYKDKVSSFKDGEVTESPHVYSESSKKVKLSSISSFPTNSKKANEDSVADKHKNDSVEKCDSFKDAVSQQRDPDLANLHPTEIKSKPTEHCVGPGKDVHVTPPRAFSNKERAQTKQEILTSKIKAHAEKEISAIKEKGFALREGFIGKSSTKPFAGQNFSIRQRPPSEEMSNKRESTASSSLSLKYQKEPPGVQIEPAKLVSPLISATIPVKSVANTTHLAEHSEKPRKANQTVNSTMSTTEGLLVQKEHGTISSVQNKEQASKYNQGKQQGYHEEISEKLQEEIDNNQATDREIKKRTEDSTQATHVKPFTTEKAESKEAAYEDSAPLDIEIGQRKASEADNNLQIMGIMVTVRERKPSVNNDQGNNCTKKQINVIDCTKSELDQWNLSSGQEENTPTKEASFVKDMDVQKTDSTIGADQAKVEQNIIPEILQKMSAMEATTNMSGSATEKKTSLQKESSTVNAKPQSETQPNPLLKDVHLADTVRAKDKVLAETQLDVCKQDIETKGNTNKTEKENLSKSTGQMKIEEKNQQQMQTAKINENFTVKVVNSGSHNNRAQTMKQNMSVIEDMTATGNNSQSSDIDAPLPEEKRHDSSLLKPFNKAIPSTTLAENENQHVSPKLKYKETHAEKNSQDDNNIHIDSIAIRVVPAATEKDIKKTFTSDMNIDKKHKLDVTSSCEEKANSLSNEHCSKDFTPANSEQMKESKEEKLTVQHVLSSVRQLSDPNKIGSKQSITNTANNESDNQKPESSIQTVDEDYFQVQRITETYNKSQCNTTIVGDNVADTSKERELRELLPNRTVICNKSCKEGKNETFGFSVDQSDSKGDKPSPASSQDENRRKKLETEASTQDLKLNDGSLERWSKNGKKETGQSNQIGRKQTETLTNFPTTDRQGLRNSHPTKANTVDEKSEPKLKTKERVSIIPEISAIADYARLKVIVSDNEEVNPVQEFPPNKKEGFFPLIQTRPSRRPVFTVDPQDLSVKEKSLSNKTELSSKVNKESQALAFPIMGKDHQRTGMFKLEDKEKQEKMTLDVKMNVDVLDNAAKYPDYKGIDTSPTAQTEVAGDYTQRLDQGTVQPNDHSLEAETSSPAANKPTNMSEGFTYFVRNSPPHSTLGHTHYRKENPTHLRNDERTEMQREKPTGAKTENGRKKQVNKERLTPQQEDIKTKQKDKKQLQEEHAFRSEKEQKEENIIIKHIIQESRASLAEEQRKATQIEEERRTREREAVAIMIKQKRENQRQVEGRTREEKTPKQSEEERFAHMSEKIQPKKWEEEIRNQRRAPEEEQRKATQEEQQKRVLEKQERTPGEQHRKDAEEQQKRASQGEQMRTAAVEKQRKVAEEQQRKIAEEQQKRAAQEEQMKTVAVEKKRKAAEKQEKRVVEEQQRRAAEEQQRTVAAEDLQKKAAKEPQRRAEEQQRKDAEVQQRRASEEQQKRTAEEQQQKAAAVQYRKVAEEQRREVAEEQQRREKEEQWRKAAEEQQKREAEEKERRPEEQQRKVADEQQQRAEEEQQRRAAEEKQRKVAEEQQRRAAEEQQKRAAEEQQRKVSEEQQRRAAEKRQKRAAEEQQRRAAEEQQRKVAGEQQRKAAQIVEQRQLKQIKDTMLTDIVEGKKIVYREQDECYISEDEMVVLIQEHIKVQKHSEEQKRTYKPHMREKWTKTQNEEEEEKEAAEREKSRKQEEKEAKYESTRLLKEQRIAQESKANRENEIQAKIKKDENLASQREKARAAQMEKQQRVTQKMDGLQYYAITDKERKPRERQQSSPLPLQQRNSPLEFESANKSASHPRPYRPPASPAPSLPRSNTSSPALGAKPLMFRVKDNTIRGSSLTKSVKPCFHKSFGEDFRVGSPLDKYSDRGEDEQDIMRPSAGTPAHPDIGSNRFTAVNESLTLSTSQNYSTSISHHRPYSRRSIVMDEDESRSVISNISEDMESVATSAADLADVRGLTDYDRPESACSFSSDVSRSMGKPPAVPPKSEKALRRAQRLTSRRIKKELSKAAAGSPAGVEKEVSKVPSSLNEVCSSKHHAVASPHFSPPVSLAHAPTLRSSMPSSHADSQSSSHRSFHASPHATGPISLTIPVPHAASTVSLPAVSSYASGLTSQPATPKTVAHVPSSPTLQHANHPISVTQYHVESSRYPQSYSLTQRKVLQDLGSGQYFVVDLPVQVKTKTFFDPETGKYVQLNVRESGQSISRPQPQQTYPQPQPQTQTQVKLQPQPLSQASTAGKPLMLYQGYNSYPQSYQPSTINPVQTNKSSAPMILNQERLPPRTIEVEQNSEEHCYSPEKTPYMDTVNNIKKPYNPACSIQDSYESDPNSQLAGNSVFENDIAVPSQCQPRDIITMSELEDFMEVSDW